MSEKNNDVVATILALVGALVLTLLFAVVGVLLIRNGGNAMIESGRLDFWHVAEVMAGMFILMPRSSNK